MKRTATILLTLCGLCLYAPFGIAPGQAQQNMTASNSASTEIAYWNEVKDTGDATKIKSYLLKFPNGMFYDVALTQYKALGGSMSGLKTAVSRHAIKTRNGHHKKAKIHHRRLRAKHKAHQHVKAKILRLKHPAKPKTSTANDPFGSQGHGSGGASGGGGGGGGSSSGGHSWGG